MTSSDQESIQTEKEETSKTENTPSDRLNAFISNMTARPLTHRPPVLRVPQYAAKLKKLTMGDNPSQEVAKDETNWDASEDAPEIKRSDLALFHPVFGGNWLPAPDYLIDSPDFRSIDEWVKGGDKSAWDRDLRNLLFLGYKLLELKPHNNPLFVVRFNFAPAKWMAYELMGQQCEGRDHVRDLVYSSPLKRELGVYLEGIDQESHHWETLSGFCRDIYYERYTLDEVRDRIAFLLQETPGTIAI